MIIDGCYNQRIYYMLSRPHFKVCINSLIIFLRHCHMTIENNARTRQTRVIEPMLSKCWPTVCDDGPTLGQHFAQCIV